MNVLCDFFFFVQFFDDLNIISIRSFQVNIMLSVLLQR